MRVGAYVDGFNLYYGGRSLCGRGTAGWRWIDLRALATGFASTYWHGATVERVVYCTARIKGADNPSGAADQDVYLKALLASSPTTATCDSPSLRLVGVSRWAP